MIHREGTPTLIISFIISILLSIVACKTLGCYMCLWAIVPIWGLFLFIVSFFRNPNRSIEKVDNNLIYAPADGKVVVIEDVQNSEYPGKSGKQISIFMSPANVHVNRIPCDGKVSYSTYHKGKYLAAWNPKSSEENERHTTVIDTKNGPILLKQIAGALARRICNYAAVDQKFKQGDEMGFIKFGSRVDVILPSNAKINVELEQMVAGNKTVIASF